MRAMVWLASSERGEGASKAAVEVECKSIKVDHEVCRPRLITSYYVLAKALEAGL